MQQPKHSHAMQRNPDKVWEFTGSDSTAFTQPRKQRGRVGYLCSNDSCNGFLARLLQLSGHQNLVQNVVCLKGTHTHTWIGMCQAGSTSSMCTTHERMRKNPSWRHEVAHTMRGPTATRL